MPKKVSKATIILSITTIALALTNAAIFAEAGGFYQALEEYASASNGLPSAAAGGVAELLRNPAFTTTASMAATFGSGAVVLSAVLVWIVKFVRSLTGTRDNHPSDAARNATRAAMRALDEIEVAARAGARTAKATSTTLRDDAVITRTGKRRGRPRKETYGPDGQPKRGRGRPRKYPPPDPNQPKRRPGRPRKNPEQ